MGSKKKIYFKMGLFYGYFNTAQSTFKKCLVDENEVS